MQFLLALAVAVQLFTELTDALLCELVWVWKGSTEPRSRTYWTNNLD